MTHRKLRTLLKLYPYFAPVVLTPLSFILWLNDQSVKVALSACLIPILFAYIVPGIGTNVLQLWEFNTRLRVGNFRPHHGFVFGSATSMFSWFCLAGEQLALVSCGDILRRVLVLSSVLGFWNVLYDIWAVRSDLLVVYNQPWAEGKAPEAIVMDYAPPVFGGFGAAYASAISVVALMDERGHFDWLAYIAVSLAAVLFSIAVPVLLYTLLSRCKHGHWGLHPIK